MDDRSDYSVTRLTVVRWRVWRLASRRSGSQWSGAGLRRLAAPINVHFSRAPSASTAFPVTCSSPISTTRRSTGWTRRDSVAAGAMRCWVGVRDFVVVRRHWLWMDHAGCCTWPMKNALYMCTATRPQTRIINNRLQPASTRSTGSLPPTKSSVDESRHTAGKLKLGVWEIIGEEAAGFHFPFLGFSLYFPPFLFHSLFFLYLFSTPR